MAGSFGYEKEHYEVSRAAGERRLFPAIRAQDPDTVIVAPGFSCRQQIGHFTEVRAVSAIEALAPLVSRERPPKSQGSRVSPPTDDAHGG
jgi:Fe-S oxidoreductase